MKKKTIKDLQFFSIQKTNLKGITIKGGDCHDTIEYYGDQACPDTYCETINDCRIVCTGEPPC